MSETLKTPCRLKIFTHWMKGTCLSCPPENRGGTKYTFTFYEDVMRVIESIFKFQVNYFRFYQQIENVHGLLRRIQEHTVKVVGEAKDFIKK